MYRGARHGGASNLRVRFPWILSYCTTHPSALNVDIFISHNGRFFLMKRWVFGTAGFAMILNYGTNLFLKISPDTNTFGHIVAASQGVGSLGALAGVQLAPFAARKGGIVYVVGTCASGLCCIIMGWSSSLWTAYPAYVASIGTNQLLLCLIYVQCAKCLSNREFILLFSLNAAAALIVQSTLQAAVVCPLPLPWPVKFVK
jgi:hypothetical protein